MNILFAVAANQLQKPSNELFELLLLQIFCGKVKAHLDPHTVDIIHKLKRHIYHMMLPVVEEEFHVQQFVFIPATLI